MRDVFYLRCPACGKSSPHIQSYKAEKISVKCGDCLMDRCEIVEMVVDRIAPVPDLGDVSDLT